MSGINFSASVGLDYMNEAPLERRVPIWGLTLKATSDMVGMSQTYGGKERGVEGEEEIREALKSDVGK